MEYEIDPAADFLNREKEELAGIITETEGLLNTLMYNVFSHINFANSSTLRSNLQSHVKRRF